MIYQFIYIFTNVAYEQAMKRWAVLCNSKMNIIPPHPSQLSQLILLRTAVERRVCYFLSLNLIFLYLFYKN